MLTDNLNRAKKLYIDHGTNGFQMMREGVLDEYKSYNISNEQEIIWRNEFLEHELSKFDINDFNLTFSLYYIIQSHLDIKYLEKLIHKVDSNLCNCKNQYSVLRFGQEIFFLLFEFVRQKSNISRSLKLNCIETCEKLLKKTKETKLPENFSIPDFKTIGEGITQEQYILRKIVELEYNIEKAKILK